ncbi:hypothetical protein Ahy_A10g047232 isoform B [Arachis hypogaea]|uniref:Uncharacterized protein n=1 Tax=Arachis hypogaea TaxID=3818 RepID=A0A445B1Y0_ARAHY|nr:hypothetical protein Ahy_A10g047232 isoform B [Arachis hypogaea]
MGHVNLLHGTVSLNKLSFHEFPKLFKQRTCSYTRKFPKFHKHYAASLALQVGEKLASHVESTLKHKVIQFLDPYYLLQLQSYGLI